MTTQLTGEAHVLFTHICHALDTMKAQLLKHRESEEDWIDVSIPEVRKMASPFIQEALDMITSNPEHKEFFRRFVRDAVSKPEFKEELKKSLLDPTILQLLKVILPPIPHA